LLPFKRYFWHGAKLVVFVGKVGKAEVLSPKSGSRKVGKSGSRKVRKSESPEVKGLCFKTFHFVGSKVAFGGDQMILYKLKRNKKRHESVSSIEINKFHQFPCVYINNLVAAAGSGFSHHFAHNI
jgi:hypothetical protein